MLEGIIRTRSACPSIFVSLYFTMMVKPILIELCVSKKPTPYSRIPVPHLSEDTEDLVFGNTAVSTPGVHTGLASTVRLVCGRTPGELAGFPTKGTPPGRGGTPNCAPRPCAPEDPTEKQSFSDSPGMGSCRGCALPSCAHRRHQFGETSDRTMGTTTFV